MRIRNTSPYDLALSPLISVLSGAEIMLKADARHILGTPLAKSYLADGALIIVDESVAKVEENKAAPKK